MRYVDDGLLIRLDVHIAFPDRLAHARHRQMVSAGRQNQILMPDGVVIELIHVANEISRLRAVREHRARVTLDDHKAARARDIGSVFLELHVERRGLARLDRHVLRRNLEAVVHHHDRVLTSGQLNRSAPGLMACPSTKT